MQTTQEDHAESTSIRFLVTPELKERFLKALEPNGATMSKILIIAIQRYILLAEEAAKDGKA